MKRSAVLTSLLLSATVLVGTGPAGAAPASAATACRTAWGSLPQTRPSVLSTEITGVRAGTHACFDRLVVDLAGRGDGWSVRYVEEVHADGSGAVVPVRGGARLEVLVVEPVRPSFVGGRELADVRGYPTFRQVAWAGSFEGQTTLGLGVRARLPFRVTLLAGPGGGSRLVVDVAHRW